MRHATHAAILVTLLQMAASAPGQTAPAVDPRQVLAHIVQTGPTKPDWWDSVTKEPPSTLRLDWTTTKGWNPKQNLGAYLRDIRSKPDTWRPAIKLLHRVVELNQGDRQKHLSSVRELANAYCLLEGDYVRGAYWYGVARRLSAPEQNPADITGLADCFVHLGCKAEAARELDKVRQVPSRTSANLRLLGAVGTPEKAAAAAQSTGGVPDAAALAAGDAFRYGGRYAEALRQYERVGALTQGGRDLPANQARARENIAAVEATRDLDLAKVADGTYEGEGQGYRGPVTVQVVTQSGRIASARVTQHNENWPGRSLTDIPTQIVAKQSLLGIDAVTGATCSSEAVLNAACRALAKGRP